MSNILKSSFRSRAARRARARRPRADAARAAHSRCHTAGREHVTAVQSSTHGRGPLGAHENNDPRQGLQPHYLPLSCSRSEQDPQREIPRALAISHLVLCRRRLSRWLLLLLRGTARRLLLCTLILLHHGGDLVLDLRRGHPARVPPSGAHRPHLGGATFRHHLGRQGRGLGRGRDGDPARGAGNGC